MKPLSEKSKQRMAMLADWIEANHIIIEMQGWQSDGADLFEAEEPSTCGTVFCAGGSCTMMNFWGYKLWKTAKVLSGSRHCDPGSYAKYWMCLDAKQSDALFYPNGFDQGEDVPEVSRSTQKTRLLRVLRGKRPLTDDWLITK